MVQGLAAFNRRWAAVPVKVREAARKALEKGAEELVQDMRRSAPRGKTRKLAESINWTWGDTPQGALTLGSFGGGKYATLRITIYAGAGHAYYARFLEFGTVKMRAHPFFYPVYRARKRRVKSRITREINKAIKGA